VPEPRTRGGRQRPGTGDPEAAPVVQTATGEQRPAGSGGVTGKGFRPGRSGNPQGRRPGVLNKATREVKELAARLLDDETYRANLLERLRSGTAGALEPLLWHYRFGKPKETVDLATMGVAIVWDSPIDPKGLRKANI